MKRFSFGPVGNYSFVSLLLLLTLFPFYLLLITSLKDQEQIIFHFWVPASPFHFENFVKAFKQIGPAIGNSFIITSGIILGVLINSTFAGYAFARYRFYGKTLSYYLIITLMMIPGFLLLIPQFILFKNMGMMNTYWVQILAPMAGSSALATMLVRTFFEGLSGSLIESAEIDGAGDVTIFSRIMIPLSLPIISTVSIINALLGWNNYIWPLVVTTGKKVWPVILALTNISGNLNEVQGIQFAGYIIASLPLLILFIFATKSFVAGITSGSVKG